jgi:hypothetical protein
MPGMLAMGMGVGVVLHFQVTSQIVHVPKDVQCGDRASELGGQR